MADLIFVLAPFVLAWRLTGWPTRHPRALVNYLGLSLMLLGASLLLRLAIFGSLPPVHDPQLPAVSVMETVEICGFTAAIGLITMLVHLFFMREEQ